jgi:plastocyanin
MQVPKKQFPIVGLLGLVVVAAAGGGVYYYQFVLSHATVTYAPSHRLVFMTAIVQEEGGFHITNTAFLNKTNGQYSLPTFNATTGVNMTGVNYQKYQGQSDNKTIDAHVGDTITFYVFGVNATSSDPALHVSKGHGFDIIGSGSFTVNTSANSPGILGGTNPASPPIPFGKWYSVTVTFNSAGSYTYLCSIVCSPLHGNMNGQIVVT